MCGSDTAWSWPELAAVVLSRGLGDGEVGSPGGSRSEIPLAAARLAQLTHAPNLAIITSAAGFVANMVDKPWSPLFPSTMDWRNVYAGTEAVLPSSGVFHTRRDWFFAVALQGRCLRQHQPQPHSSEGRDGDEGARRCRPRVLVDDGAALFHLHA
jgi:glutaconate CoA-transferase subunit B